MNVTYELHPLCTLFPRMAGAEFASLVDDIKNNGQREPIIVHDGMILDGGNRYRACIEAGIEPQTMRYGGGNIVAYVLSANLHRRHMTPGQQAAIVASAQDWGNAHRVGKPLTGNLAGLDKIEDRMSQSGASDRTQRMADKVAKADPELAKRVGRGETSLPKAIEQITGKRPGAKVAEQAAEPEYNPTEHELQEARDAITDLAEQNASLRDRIAVNALDLSDEDKEDLYKEITDLREEVKSLEAAMAAITSMRDSLMRENAEMKKQLLSQRNQIKKLGGK